jgi:hypothetical protein
MIIHPIKAAATYHRLAAVFTCHRFRKTGKSFAVSISILNFAP